MLMLVFWHVNKVIKQLNQNHNFSTPPPKLSILRVCLLTNIKLFNLYQSHRLTGISKSNNILLTLIVCSRAYKITGIMSVSRQCLSILFKY